MNKVNVKCKEDYFGDERSRFFITKNQVKKLPDNLTPELENALNDGLLTETKELEKGMNKIIDKPDESKIFKENVKNIKK